MQFSTWGLGFFGFVYLFFVCFGLFFYGGVKSRVNSDADSSYLKKISFLDLIYSASNSLVENKLNSIQYSRYN